MSKPDARASSPRAGRPPLSRWRILAWLLLLFAVLPAIWVVVKQRSGNRTHEKTSVNVPGRSPNDPAK